ncbi:hypothetical protein [Amycolatopsis alkalitolerans]|uniref:Uncharacterized protein n=1 Tax=Amycolatopsis alkalitolerans TaxID=2547244 RepID=A0A5C4LSC6_9PSEU|nr:hypothetical protein [Amycolatopsis alkalitolerans]TNC19059.1 hypothetical protein FG385_32860 [Amycolatopsis alkalitolerans]
MEFELKLGAKLDLLTRGELADELATAQKRWMQQSHTWQLGKKRLSLPVARGTADVGGNLSLGSQQAADQVLLGPRQGFVWKVVRISFATMAASDTIAIYKGEPNAARFVAQLGGGAGGGTYNPSRGLMLKAGDYLVLSTELLAGSLTAGDAYAVSGEVDEVPAEMIGKLID